MDALDDLYAATDPKGWACAMDAAEADPAFAAAHRAWLLEAVAEHERGAALTPAAE